MGPARSSVRARRRAALVAYLQMAPAAEVIDACRRCEDPGENEGAESSSPHSSSSFGDVAQDALHRCVTHPIATSHPPTKAYIARLLKLATIEAERGGQTLNDRLVGHLVQQTFLQDGTDDGWCHKTYAYGELLQGSDTDDDDTEDGDVLANRRTVSFRMHRNLFEGGTGCHEWHAGFYLAELAATHPKILDGRRVLELGSGCGLAATVMARGGTKVTSSQRGCRGVPSRLILTDADADALVNLTANLAANDVAVGGEKNTHPIDDSQTIPNKSVVTTARLDWEDFDEDTLRAYRTDLIVASDVLYDPLNITPLLNVCGCLLGTDEESFGDGDNHNQSQNQSHIPGDDESAPAGSWVDDVANNRRAVFVTTLRQPETLAKFETEATARGFEPRDVTADVFDAIGADGLFERVRGLDRRGMRVHVLRPPRVG
jgi:predicted nicotinamide N-methyase